MSFLIMFIAGLLAKNSFSNLAGVNAKTVDDVSKLEFYVNPMDEFQLENLLKYEDEYVDESIECDNIVGVQALGEFGNFGMLTEKAKIVKVYKSKDYKVGEVVEIAHKNTFEEQKIGSFLYHGLAAPMTKGKKYLCFLSKCKKYEQLGLNVAENYGFYSCICLDGNEEKLFDLNKKYKFSDLEGVDMMCETKEVYDVITRTEKRIVEKVMETYK